MKNDRELHAGQMVQTKVWMNTLEVVEWQIMHYCFVQDVPINRTELKLLALLGAISDPANKVRVTAFCEKAVDKKILMSTQAVNTAMHKLYRTGLFIKEGGGKKFIYLNPKLNILSKGNFVINLMVIKLETNGTTRNLSTNSKKAELAS